MEDANGGGQAKTWGPRGAGVEIKDTVDDPAEGTMAMAEDDHVRRRRLEPAEEGRRRGEGIDDVFDENALAPEFSDFRVAPAGMEIVVAGDDGHWGDLFELNDQVGVSDIPGMEDVLNALEQIGDTRVEMIVGVGDEPEFHGRSRGMPDGEERGKCKASRFFKELGWL